MLSLFFAKTLADTHISHQVSKFPRCSILLNVSTSFSNFSPPGIPVGVFLISPLTFLSHFPSLSLTAFWMIPSHLYSRQPPNDCWILCMVTPFLLCFVFFFFIVSSFSARIYLFRCVLVSLRMFCICWGFRRLVSNQFCLRFCWKPRGFTHLGSVFALISWLDIPAPYGLYEFMWNRLWLYIFNGRLFP